MRKILFFTLIATVFLAHQTEAQANFDFFFKDSSQYQDVIIDDVLSADRILLQSKTNEKREIVKLIGLNGPKAPKRKKVNLKRDEHNFVVKEKVSPLTPIEEKAYEFAKELLLGKRVRLEFDHEKNSEDFETLAYVYLLEDGTFANAEILRHGFANLQIRPPNTKYAQELRNAYQEARAEKRGLQGN